MCLFASSRRARQTIKSKIWRQVLEPDTITLQQVIRLHPGCLPVGRMASAPVQLEDRAAGRCAKPSPAEMNRGHREWSSTHAVVTASACRIQRSAHGSDVSINGRCTRT